MATANQIYTVVNAIAEQTLGKIAITVTDTSTLMSLGNDILSTDKTLDVFVNALADRIGRTIISMRRYSPDSIGMVRQAFEFGVALQKIYIDLPDAAPNNAWEIGKEEYEPVYMPITKSEISQKIFANLTTFEFDLTIPDDILRTAFVSAQGMAVLIDGMFLAMDNRITMALESMTDLVRASFIARKLKGKKPCGVINLLTDYNTKTNSELKAADCMMDTGFLKYAAVQIKLWTKRMRRMSVLFNEEGYKRHTPDEDRVLVLLDEFDASLTAYLDSDVFHNELLALPNFTTVPYWQGSGLTFAFDDTSAINVKLDDKTTVEAKGVIAVAYDYQAMGVTIDNRKVTTQRNEKDEYTNYYNKTNKGYFNDMSENGIVFVVQDAAE